MKTYALEIGISEKEWDDGVNKAVDKYYGSKYDKAKTRRMSFTIGHPQFLTVQKELKK